MTRIFSNGPRHDYVSKEFERLANASSRLFLAAPYFTLAGPVLKAAKEDKEVNLLVGLNSTTSSRALEDIHEVPGIAVRYLTCRFHAKIYIFDRAALIGSSNLTDAGLNSNREAVVCLDRPEDVDTVEEIRVVYSELWEDGHELTSDKLETFVKIRARQRGEGPDYDAEIEEAVGRAEPWSISVDSRVRSPRRVFLEGLSREFGEYRRAYTEVNDVLEARELRRPDLKDLPPAFETNRLLNWVRLTHVKGDEAWQTAPIRNRQERHAEVVRIGRAWVHADDNLVDESYKLRIETVHQVFGSAAALSAMTMESITDGLMSIHAFTEQYRFVKGGEKNLPTEFWSRNEDDVARVKSTLSYLLFGQGGIVERLHDILYDPKKKLSLFAYFCALELYGTVNTEECPPMNGRMAKAMRYLGFDVRAA